METNQSLNLAERFNQWLKESITVKLVSIGFLILVLLIPSAWIQNLMEERQLRAESVITEISEKWSGNQTLSGPILVIPYKIGQITRKAFFLPESLTINGEITPEIRERGIFDAVVYTSQLQTRAVFSEPDFKKLEINTDMVQWKDAHLIVAITDLRGVSDDPKITVGEQTLPAEPAQQIGILTRKFTHDISQYAQDTHQNFSGTGILIPLNWESAESFTGKVTLTFDLKGSDRLSFIPSGKTTTVDLKGPWADPSFDGEFLPTHNISSANFTAQWKILHFNRPFSQQWKEDGVKLAGSEFGLKLLIPVDQYQKSIRTSKYSQLIILLTFMALFLVEITQKVRIHPFQYILIGAALIIYYTLLLSFSEQTGYTTAYWISAIATVALITTYSTTFLKNRRLCILFALLLSVFYSFIYIIILQQDFSLLIGSIGLFLIVAALMYFSRKVNWYNEGSVDQIT
jgi:inner membrane protein